MVLLCNLFIYTCGAFPTLTTPDQRERGLSSPKATSDTTKGSEAGARDSNGTQCNVLP